jgi:DNA mismatch repair protein MutL
MPRRIHVLPDRLVNQIAAGEVVERPASVVKELVENALDAGSTRVEIVVRNGGKTEIRVADDGHGMGRDDALLALDRHATSKLRSEADLASIHTLGFRGEALPSIASVSRLVLETAEREGSGTRVVVAGGQLSAVEPCARRSGTTISVRSLFYNVPARAKFLRSAAAESRAISETVTTIALVHPEVSFSLESNGRPVLELPAAAESRARIAALWGHELAGELVALAHTSPAGSLGGWVQRPDRARAGIRRAHIFVNGRPIVDRALARAAYRGFRTTVPSGVTPWIFLFLEVPDAAVDVNVHPAKAEVRLRDRTGVEQLVEDGVRGALGTLSSAAHLALESRGEAGAAVPGREGDPSGPATAAAASDSAPWTATLDAAPAAQDQMSLFVSGPVATGSGGNDTMPTAPALRSTAPAMWQIHNTYIATETRSGLILVDQHSAHERVLYEQLMRGFSAGVPASQRLLFPMTMRLSAAEFSVVEQLQSLFAAAGFEIEPFGGRSVIVHAVPVPHRHFDAERCLREMIAELATGSELVDSARNQHQRMALTFACKGAIKAGQHLSDEEMRELFDRLFATELPYHDIHGRPTVVQIELAELHNRFRRHG